MTVHALLAAAEQRPNDRTLLAEAARSALAAGEEERALPGVRRAAERFSDARLWLWTGHLERSLDEHARALRAFDQAARLAPTDASIARDHARVALEAGVDSVELFARALSLAPHDGDVLLGMAAARIAIGDGERAAAELERTLEQAPLWTVGHQQLAQLRSTLGQRELVTASLERALTANPGRSELWKTLFGIRLRMEDYRTLAADISRARAVAAAIPELPLYDAICAGELEDEACPPALFGAAPPGSDASLNIWRIRHLLRVGRIEEAGPIVDAELATERAPFIWPYALLVWRLTGDSRAGWLEGDPRLVSIADLTADLPDLSALAAQLRRLHVARGEFLDQSVRGGTQTDGPLFCRIEPEIRQLRSAVVAAVARYVAQLPPPDPKHPLLAPRRDRRIRFSGSWSVLLRSGGRHSNHVHPQGWISSALYVSLPQRGEGEPEHSGWLTLGEPHPGLKLGLPPFAAIEPKVARLVLFPSWMWHGTVPFANGERLTVAFDVAAPR